MKNTLFPHFVYKGTNFLLIIVLLTSCMTIQKSMQDCAELKQGKFIQHFYNETGLGHWRHFSVQSARNDSIEYCISSLFPGDTSFYRINWPEACTYRNKLLNPTNFLDSAFTRTYPAGYNLKIWKIEADYYLTKEVGPRWIRFGE